jgi:quercetin dioxygenase-like cupin family protein
MRRAAMSFFTVFALAGLSVMAQIGQGDFGRRPVFTNESVDVTRLLLLPGSSEAPHSHGYSIMFVHLTSGDTEALTGTSTTKGARAAGSVEFVSKDVLHAIANVGREPFELLTIAFNPDRLRGGTAAPAPPPAGITRTPLLDNTDATVTRLEFAPSARETVHMHPYDLVVVPLTAARVDVEIGSTRETRALTPGDAFFIERFEPHAVANLGSEAMIVLGVAIK